MRGRRRSGPIAPFTSELSRRWFFRSDDRGATWSRSSQIDQLPTRSTWYSPPPPHERHVRSIDFLPNDARSVLVGIEVGGVLLSHDRGETWAEMNHGVYVDIHSKVRAGSRGALAGRRGHRERCTSARTALRPRDGSRLEAKKDMRSGSASIPSVPVRFWSPRRPTA